ncbi:mitochondrial 54S ribosomal protein bL28m NDAI_0I00710 [Naumovozyma dairenensis CBS 421]|uniref:Large ribosomal subunit protein bL28m n=1 Tax=Naumovozyma dairenensis (strain ATCC 10597 / BCRC 20456 / CBS 421 / NBRC 0211 / NRRL Y-12639) TaxID=1071378 RepID=G0WFS9_NAUDC|nr:hypothetical protein NDAI_0I00710 [Naumovozyma dairenensis CBS 421]CCD26640.1 hypothetical protein NDAI_0I00710 [Naumovozyma dairenensis CBS 421]
MMKSNFASTVNTFISKRSFASTAYPLRQWKLIESRNVGIKPRYKVGDPRPIYIPKERLKFPDYKYGESNIFKQSNKGLYGGSFVQYGNSISESKQKTRRRWLPNIVKKGLWSETLGRNISIKLTTKVLKTISKEGGIDNYLIKDKSARIKELGPTGWKLRYLVLKKKELDEIEARQLENKIVKDDGTETQFYSTEILNGEKVHIIVGKRKLLKYLYPLEKLESVANSEFMDYKRFIELYAKCSFGEIISKLNEHNFDMTTITIPSKNATALNQVNHHTEQFHTAVI